MYEAINSLQIIIYGLLTILSIILILNILDFKFLNRKPEIKNRREYRKQGRRITDLQTSER